MALRQSGVGVLVVFVILFLLAGSWVEAPQARADGPAVAVVGGGGTPSAGALPAATQGPQPRSRMGPQVAAAPATARASAYPVFGIDVASHQGNVGWAKVRSAGARFAYVKATEGTTYVNPYFDQQYGGAKAAGLYVGAYVFARPDGNAAKQARYFYNHAQYVRDGKTMPLMLDMEGPYGDLTNSYNMCWNRKPSGMVSWMHTFINEIRQLSGSPVLIYTNNWWWNQCTGDSTQFATEYLNTAYWSSTEPTTLPASWTKWTVWQYTGSGSIAGVNGAVDRDVFNGSLAELKRFADKPVKNAQAQRLIPNDFNLDGHTDLAVFHPKTGNWGVRRDTGTTWQHFGVRGDIPLTWNSGDGWAKMAVFRPWTGMWYLADHLGKVKYAVHYGTRGDVPVPAHYNGIAKSTALAVFRPWTGDWYVRGRAMVHYGTRGDIPVPADYNGDGKTDIAVYRPSDGMWYVRGQRSYRFGIQADTPVTADVNGDGRAEPVVYRQSKKRFYIWGHASVAVGNATSIPIGRAPYRG